MRRYVRNSNSRIRDQKMANITQAGINDTSHPCYSPLYDVAEVLVVDIIVLFSD